MKKRGPGYVYLVHAVGTPYYKVGHATNIQKRLYQINQHNPGLCVLIHAIPVNNQAEAEYWWHGLFADKRVKAEWFELTEKQVELFSLCQGGSIHDLHREVYEKHHVLFMETMDGKS